MPATPEVLTPHHSPQRGQGGHPGQHGPERLFGKPGDTQSRCGRRQIEVEAMHALVQQDRRHDHAGKGADGDEGEPSFQARGKIDPARPATAAGTGLGR